jgi:hypothetical protein
MLSTVAGVEVCAVISGVGSVGVVTIELAPGAAFPVLFSLTATKQIMMPAKTVQAANIFQPVRRRCLRFCGTGS